MSSTLDILLFFHAKSSVDSLLCDRRVRSWRNVSAQTEATIGIAMRRILKAFSSLCHVGDPCPLSKVIASYMTMNR